MKLAALSVDLDEVPCYADIHGLADAGDDESRQAIYARALPRLEALFDQEGIRATFFVIGRDIASPGNELRLSRLARAGHELGNHTFHHRYDFTRRSAESIREDIAQAHLRIETAAGVAPVGFRAPGYTFTDTVLRELRRLGYRYDSSVFPCPPYYSAKALAMGLIRARGRRSESILDSPRVLTAPADPYLMGDAYRRPDPQGDIVELPIGVTRGPRLPYIGTSVVLGGERTARTLTRMMRGRPFVNLELHGIDLADADEDGLGWLAPHQPDLRRRAAEKRAALRTAIRTLRDMGYTFVTLAEAAEQVRLPAG